LVDRWTPLRDPLGLTLLSNTLGPELEKLVLGAELLLAVSSARSSCSVVHLEPPMGDELGLILDQCLEKYWEVLGTSLAPYLESWDQLGTALLRTGLSTRAVTGSTRTDAVEDTGTRAEQHLAGVLG
jgi:hypothetical protein